MTAWWVIICAWACMTEGLVVEDLRVENMRGVVLGVETQRPRASWLLSESGFNLTQTSYRVRLSSGDIVVWDSGRVQSHQNALVGLGVESFGSSANTARPLVLSAATCYVWSVRCAVCILIVHVPL
jgi:hypothetical protein